jgi:hypothetical protein
VPPRAQAHSTLPRPAIVLERARRQDRRARRSARPFRAPGTAAGSVGTG